MKVIDEAKSGREFADEIIARRRLLNNSYLNGLRDGRVSKEQFISSQQQFYYAVAEYSKPIAILTSRVNDLRFRFELLRNLLDEHGEFNEKACHEHTFREFISRLGGVDPRSVEISPAVFAFNSVLMAVSLNSEIEKGIACLAMIEYSFAFISSTIAAAIIRRGWLPPELMTHYSLHSSLDLKHADALFVLVAPAFANNAKRKHVIQGFELGAFIFERLYDDLYAEYCQFELLSSSCA